jgi:hypothetical protein
VGNAQQRTGENGRTILRYNVIVYATPVGGEIIHRLAHAGAPRCLSLDYSLHKTAPSPKQLLNRCRSGLDWISHRFVPSLGLILITRSRLAVATCSSPYATRPPCASMASLSLPTPIPAALSELFLRRPPKATVNRCCSGFLAPRRWWRFGAPPHRAPRLLIAGGALLVGGGVGLAIR